MFRAYGVGSGGSILDGIKYPNRQGVWLWWLYWYKVPFVGPLLNMVLGTVTQGVLLLRALCWTELHCDSKQAMLPSPVATCV